MNESDLLHPLGPDGPELSVAQVLTTAALIKIFQDASGEGVPWTTCENGCCVLIHEPHKDEHVWTVARSGDVEKVDRYGNSVEYVPLELDETIDEMVKSILEDIDEV